MKNSAARRWLAAGAIVTFAVAGGAVNRANAADLSDRASPAPGEGAPLGYGAASALGLVEGVTEFLPVSSTGHLILTNHLLDLDRPIQARELGSGAPLWKVPPDAAARVAGEPFTVKAVADQYAIVIQFGAILAVAIIYWRAILSILAGLIGRDPAGLRLLRNLLVAFFPAVVLGLLLDDWIDTHLFSVQAVAGALVVGAILMLIVSRWARLKAANAGTAGVELPDPAPADLTVMQALVIGLMQCVSLWPGTSRSMMTLVGGYFVGLRPARAAEFSFLLGLPTLAGAATYKALGSGGVLMVKAFGIAPLIVGGLVAAVSAAIAVRWMVAYLTKHGLALFAWYRLGVAAIVVWHFW